MNVNDVRNARKVVWGSRVAVAAMASALLFAGCGRAGEGRGPALLVLTQLTGASGADPSSFSNVLASDVLTFVKAGSGLVPTVYEDPGQALLSVRMKDVVGLYTSNNAVTLTRYRVVYIRPDGRNTPGVDVPYPFDGAVSQTVTNGGSAVGFTLVRSMAKSEAPLQALIGSGGSQFISAIAQVTFYGTDAAGNTVSVTGQMSVTFSDWGDPV
jgi:hypothetical protein